MPAPPTPAKPVVWVQAGHAPPLEPGYRSETGAVDGPFETEAGVTLPVAQRVVRQLRSWGADARLVKGKVTPLGAPGAVFLSIHHDAEGGQEAIAWATEPKAPLRRKPGRRAPTQVDAPVERESRHLAVALHERSSQAFRAGDGAGTELGHSAPGRAATCASTTASSAPARTRGSSSRRAPPETTTASWSGPGSSRVPWPPACATTS